MQVWEISLVIVVFSSVYGWQLGCKSCQKDTNEFYQTIVQSKSLESIHNPSTLFFQWSHIFMHVTSHFRRKVLSDSRPHVTHWISTSSPLSTFLTRKRSSSTFISVWTLLFTFINISSDTIHMQLWFSYRGKRFIAILRLPRLTKVLRFLRQVLKKHSLDNLKSNQRIG